jgi:hypothetical protein
MIHAKSTSTLLFISCHLVFRFHAEELGPFHHVPRAIDLVCNQPIPEDSWRDMYPILPREFDCGLRTDVGTKKPLLVQITNQEVKDVLLYLRSSVTPTPPLGVVFNLRSSLNSSILFGITWAASPASFSRICSGVNVEEGISK